ncbi:MAG: adenylate/guanylate cyclase domain-containing protein [Verrucomicrobia bacterium]|nr:adenylate/guanylate cyclase domain-containing protein [Verrucomicrobiota bacterium]
MTLLLSAGALILASWLATSQLRTVEMRLGDALMRLRLEFQGSRPTRELVLVGLDETTRQKLGKFSGGRWAARGPYLNQLRFFREYLRPSVLAYDINFKDALGSAGRVAARVSESPRLLHGIVEDLSRVAADDLDAVSFENLQYLAQFEVEQGTRHLAHQLAGAYDNHSFPVVLAYNFRGGWSDPQSAQIPGWSVADMVGSNPQGGLDDGERLPYLFDVRIPASRIDLSAAIDATYDYAPNASTPGTELLDYSLLGHINVPRDEDGVVRKVPLVIGFSFTHPGTRKTERVYTPSLSLLSVMLHLGIQFPLEDHDPDVIDVRMGDRIVLRPAGHDEIVIPIDQKGRMLLNYDVGIHDFPSISFSEFALAHEPGNEDARDRVARRYKAVVNGSIVLIGMVATGDIDIGPTPLESHTPFVTVHLTAIHNLLSRSFIRYLSVAETWTLYGACFIFFTTICIFVRSPALAFISSGSMIVYLAAAYACLGRDIALLPLLGPLLYIALCGFGTLSYAYAIEGRDRRIIRTWFSKMVSPTVLQKLEDNPQAFSLEGSEVDATVFFSDVIDFTSISEGLAPDRLTSLMNAYLTAVTVSIQTSDGYLNKYIGDMVMAVWGAPNPVKDHALVACRSALAQRRLIMQHGPQWELEYGVNLDVRMGINSGVMKAGGLGSEERLEYTVMGDAVNLASRLEPLNRDYGTSIIIGPVTARSVRDELVVRALDRVIVKGKHEAVEIFELIGERGDVAAETLEVIARYEEALRLHYERQWDEAMRLLNENVRTCADGPSQALGIRVTEYKVSPPGPGWQGDVVRVT